MANTQSVKCGDTFLLRERHRKEIKMERFIETRPANQKYIKRFSREISKTRTRYPMFQHKYLVPVLLNPYSPSQLVPPFNWAPQVNGPPVNWCLQIDCPPPQSIGPQFNWSPHSGGQLNKQTKKTHITRGCLINRGFCFQGHLAYHKIFSDILDPTHPSFGKECWTQTMGCTSSWEKLPTNPVRYSVPYGYVYG